MGQATFLDHLNDLDVERAPHRNFDAIRALKTENHSQITSRTRHDNFGLSFSLQHLLEPLPAELDLSRCAGGSGGGSAHRPREL